MIAKNGENDYGVSFGRIMFLDKILRSHTTIAVRSRHDDIIFEVERLDQGDHLTVACLDTYVASLEIVMRVTEEFPNTNVIFVGGKWNGYTQEAYDFCKERNIGIYNAGEFAGGIHRKDFWSYEKFDEDGNSLKSVKS